MNETPRIRCVVVDDELLSVKLIADYVRKTPDLELVLETTHPQEALALIQRGGADLVLLDIQMPEMTGFEFMQLAGSRCGVIFTTAYPQYGADSYNYNAIDYLLKPVTFARFLAAIQKTKLRISQENKPAHEKSLPVQEHLFIKTEYRIQKVDLDEILYLEALRDYIAVHLHSSKILTLESMKNMEERLPAGRFIRIHKSYIINKDRIDFLSRGRVIINQVYLPIGNTYKERFQQLIGIRDDHSGKTGEK
ncbi:LytTR family DNA-binding domain-containing protein [Terrimonas sp. NA20]|uniref:LytTR family DNA-binding domain-containing protein n=1 Tax=Terrimonas ginsenosidimutans TaxID=2908004 RepID=A0ABS9L0P3_9BACT|nr:LytTR family DNA-binding domain-containing protein [Terrimonas ginsenosidimutans]MCG2618143.1 LytTR family DNA-binding domain-containing protein [Terrimonas ginsenosidimutans]